MSRGSEDLSKNVVEAMSGMNGIATTIGSLAERARRLNGAASTSSAMVGDIATDGVSVDEMVAKMQGTLGDIRAGVLRVEQNAHDAARLALV
jgi:methyl-accepting chemotaxis protein